MSDFLLLDGAVRVGTPLAIAALGETVVERSGVLNIGLEGCIITGALAGAAATSLGGTLPGMIVSGIAGLCLAAVFAYFTALRRVDQIVTGTAINLLAFGLTGTLYRIGASHLAYTSSAMTLTRVAIPLLSTIPWVGPAFFTQSAATYVLYLATPLTWWFLFRTSRGLQLRAIGEAPEAALAAGVDGRHVQFTATCFGGFMGGLAGGALVLTQTGSFVEGMSEGRGFIALAIVALGRWSPGGVLLASLLFGAAGAVQFLFQAQGWAVPYQFFLAMPYVVVIVSLALTRGRMAAPAALGRRTIGLD